MSEQEKKRKLEEKLNSLIDKRRALVLKKFDVGLSQEEELKLKDIDQEIDLVEMSLWGKHLDNLEQMIGKMKQE